MVTEIESASTGAIMFLTTYNFVSSFQDWDLRWTKCIELGGTYFEAIKVELDDSAENGKERRM